MALLQSLKEGDCISIQLSSAKNAVNGLYYCFDPESESVILQNTNGHLMWINGHDIKSIKRSSQKIESSDKPLQLLMMGKIKHKSKQILQEIGMKNVKLSKKVRAIQQELMKFLEKHHLYPTLDKDTNQIKIGSCLYIIPPYSADCCRSDNEIILSTTLKLLNEFHDARNKIDKEKEVKNNDSEDLIEID